MTTPDETAAALQQMYDATGAQRPEQPNQTPEGAALPPDAQDALAQMRATTGRFATPTTRTEGTTP